MRKQDAWAQFWRGGSLTSFGSRFAQGYEGEVRELWTEFFESLPDDAIIADLGAGNGALEEIASRYCESSGRKMTVHAFDLAPSLPEAFKGERASDRCRIIWHTSTRNESTGLDDRSIDAVTSSYAYEYGDDELTAHEILRILKPSGRCRFLMHYAGSKIISGSRNELAVLQAEMRKGGFFDAVRDYLREFGDIRKPSQFQKMKASGKAEKFRKRMNDAHLEVVKLIETEHAASLVEDIMKWTGQLVSPPGFFQPKDVLLDQLRGIREEYQASISRLTDMQGAAVNEERLARIAGYFAEGGMSMEYDLCTFSDAPAPVGWKVDVRKP